VMGAFRSVCGSGVCACVVECVGHCCERGESLCCLSVDVVDETFVGCGELWASVCWCLFWVGGPAFRCDPLVVVGAVGGTCSGVPVDSVVCLWMVFGGVVVDVAVPRRSSVFGQSSVQILPVSTI